VGPPFVEEDVARSPRDGGGCGELLEAVVDTDGLGRSNARMNRSRSCSWAGQVTYGVT
jgi:hypothetical protein